MSEAQRTDRHRIRLQGPWEWAVPTSSPALAWTWNRIRLPEEWERLPALPGEAWFRRRFQSPTGLTSNDRLWIILNSTVLPEQVVLNGIKLLPVAEPIAPGTHRYAATDAIARRNLVEISYMGGVDPTDPLRRKMLSVVLEIESSSVLHSH